MTSSLERARRAFDRQAWDEASAAFISAAEQGSLAPADNEQLAISAYLTGREEDSAAAWEAASRSAGDAGRPADAARCAFWLAVCLMLAGHMAQANGWLQRVRRMIAEAEVDCAAQGYLLIPELLRSLDAGDPMVARDLAVSAGEVGRRFEDADLQALSMLGHGQSLIAMGDTREGFGRLDEVMVAVTAGEVGPITSGIVYCAVILECMQLFDLQRAAEWTDALEAWCDAQPDLVPYRGQCLVHRSQLQQAAGAWPDALVTAEEACRRLTDPPHPALGLAHYQEAELHRLVGAFADAETSYRQASRHGHHAMPGLALLDLACGRGREALAAIRRALHERVGQPHRYALLSGAADILAAAGAVEEARAAAEELAAGAERSSSAVLSAMAAHAQGVVLIAAGDHAAALPALRTAVGRWRAQHMPYEAARSGVVLAQSCGALGDHASATLELDSAAETFAQLGAQPDLERLAGVRHGLGVGAPADGSAVAGAGLSARERQVLALVAAGRTNRQIAAELVISKHTVSRHLENIFAKLGVRSRAAATAHAYEHDLL